MVDQWILWLGDRLTASSSVPTDILRLELLLLIDVFGSMVGPLRRETKAIWQKNCSPGEMLRAEGIPCIYFHSGYYD